MTEPMLIPGGIIYDIVCVYIYIDYKFNVGTVKIILKLDFSYYFNQLVLKIIIIILFLFPAHYLSQSL